jgi:hypothetical protein
MDQWCGVCKLLDAVYHYSRTGILLSEKNERGKAVSHCISYPFIVCHKKEKHHRAHGNGCADRPTGISQQTARWSERDSMETPGAGSDPGDLKPLSSIRSVSRLRRNQHRAAVGSRRTPISACRPLTASACTLGRVRCLGIRAH